MVGEDSQDMKREKIALPPPVKRRDHHLCKLFHSYGMKINACFNFNVAPVSITQIELNLKEDSAPISAFGVDFSSNSSSKHM